MFVKVRVKYKTHQHFKQQEVLINMEIPRPQTHLLNCSLWEDVLKKIFKKHKCENQELKHTVQLLFSKQTLNKISYIWNRLPFLKSVKPKQMGAFSSMYYYCPKVGA